MSKLIGKLPSVKRSKWCLLAFCHYGESRGRVKGVRRPSVEEARPAVSQVCESGPSTIKPSSLASVKVNYCTQPARSVKGSICRLYILRGVGSGLDRLRSGWVYHLYRRCTKTCANLGVPSRRFSEEGRGGRESNGIAASRLACSVTHSDHRDGWSLQGGRATMRIPTIVAGPSDTEPLPRFPFCFCMTIKKIPYS